MKSITRIAIMLILSVKLSSCQAPPLKKNGENNLPSEVADEAIIKITVLGSGTPVPSRTQFGAAVLVEAGGNYFMFDCGRGCSARLGQLDPALLKKVNNLFLTHMHSDHVTGIPGLWLNGWTQERKVPLRTRGPIGTEAMMKNLRAAFALDIAFRQADGVPTPSNGLDNDFQDISPEGGLVYEKDGIAITAFRVDHSTVTPAYGYKLEYAGKSAVISGDTTVAPNLYKYGADTDVLLLEVMSPALVNFLEKNFNSNQVETIKRYHLSAEQAGDIFSSTKPGLAVYYHTRNEPKFVESLIDKTRELYNGPLKVSHDLFQIQIHKNEILTKSVNPEQ